MTTLTVARRPADELPGVDAVPAPDRRHVALRTWVFARRVVDLSMPHRRIAHVQAERAPHLTR